MRRSTCHSSRHPPASSYSGSRPCSHYCVITLGFITCTEKPVSVILRCVTDVRMATLAKSDLGTPLTVRIH
ncbi:hypothetical protein GDO81_011286 [Engystomops pustulosus]|uniref:Uncharacterized protein n=1 Tax=Engystomops pustulosus TaxID=76066 RepID=A0AAV7BD36_ENGPU|nr:hypothetical protein GDO81_011286 [Engystomops pustulosus]